MIRARGSEDYNSKNITKNSTNDGIEQRGRNPEELVGCGSPSEDYAVFAHDHRERCYDLHPGGTLFGQDALAVPLAAHPDMKHLVMNRIDHDDVGSRSVRDIPLVVDCIDCSALSRRGHSACCKPSTVDCVLLVRYKLSNLLVVSSSSCSLPSLLCPLLLVP